MINEQEDNVNYQLKSIDILQSDKAKQIFAKGEKSGWDLNKILTELAIPKEQKQLLLDLGIKDREQLAIELASRYSYGIKINTATTDGAGEGYGNEEPIEINGRYYIDDDMGGKNEITKDQYMHWKNSFILRNTKYYSNLTVPGGTNYTEERIITPEITPSIKGHPSFAQDNDIGWFRSDEKISKGLSHEEEVRWAKLDKQNDWSTEEFKEFSELKKKRESVTETNKERRVLEVQSDLFQKGRDKSYLSKTQIDNDDRPSSQEEADRLSRNQETSNQFLQLLNKDNNWVTFFIKSIIQDSAKKGYEKVLFPKGETAAKVEGHQTIADEIEDLNRKIELVKNRKIPEIGTLIDNPNYDPYFYNGELDPELYYIKDNKYYWHDIDAGHFGEDTEKEITKEVYEKGISGKLVPTDERTKERIPLTNELKIKALDVQKQDIEYFEKQKSELKSQGIEKLKPIEAFYEIKVTNVLKKNYQVKEITDEFGNSWNEIDLTKEKITKVQNVLNVSKLASSQIYLREAITKEDVIPSKSVEDSMKEVLSESEVKTTVSDLNQLDRLSEIKQRALKALEFKYEKIQLRKKTLTSKQKLEGEEFLKKLEKLDAQTSLIQFATHAAKRTDAIYQEWMNIKKQLDQIDKGELDKDKSKLINPARLYAWKDYLSAYDSLDDFRNAMTEDGTIDSVDPLVKKTLDDAIFKKNAIKRLYDVMGIDMVAEHLAPYYNKVYKDFELEVGKKYKSLPESEKSRVSETEYIQAQKELNNEDLRQQTINLLKNELRKANKDIGLATRLVGNLLNSSDPVLAAMGQAMGFSEIETHSKRVEFRDKLVPVLKELEQLQKGKTKLQDIYDFMLEKDSMGNPTGYTISKFGSKFWNEYDKVKQESKSYEKISSTEKSDIIRKWVRKNTTFDKQNFSKDKWEYIDKLKESGVISNEDYKQLEWNEISYTPYAAHDLFEAGVLSEHTADLVASWTAKHIWDYRTTTDEWENTQWDKFQKLVKSNPNDARVKFYNLIKEYEDEANSYLPSSQRLRNGQLPGILKSSSERLQVGESFARLTADAIKKSFNVLADETGRGNKPIIDEQGNIRYFIPVHYTGKLDIKDQSFDLATIYSRFYSMAADYNAKNEVFPVMEMARHFVEDREIARTDSKGNPIKKIFKITGKESTESKAKLDNKLAEQLNDWFEMVFYGVAQKDEGSINLFGLNIDKAKGLDWISKTTAYNILSLNLRAGVANILVSEVLQAGEAFAGQHMSLKSYHKAHTYYFSHFGGILDDIGKLKPTSIINLLDEKFNISTSPLESKFLDNTRLKQLARASSLFMFQTMGDSYENNKVFLGMLIDKKAYDKDGKVIGSLLDFYTKDKDGNLVFDKDSKVDINKSQWTDIDQKKFSIKTRGVIEGIQGNYSDLGRVALQRTALGRMGIMFRKFIVPGIEKRYKKKSYTERMQDYTEGYYRTTGKFLTNLAKEFRTYQFAVMGEEWEKLSDMEKSNIIRTVSEVGFVLLSTVLAGLMMGGEDDDKDRWVYDFATYQLLRLKTELLFYTNPAEAMQILRSPAATMSLFETTMKAFHQILNPLQEYKVGPWKGHLKFEKIMWDFIPVMRSLYQARDVKNQVNFLK